MSPQQYSRVGEIYHAALDRTRDQRQAYLEQACAGDEILRHSVESLLVAHEKAGGFMASIPGAEAETESFYRPAISLEGGRTLGSYEVLAQIGAGGMGEVYLAQDTRLGRNVAIKLLPKNHCLDPERVWRFEREARAASALNHPNIITIYDIGSAEEGRFIVMEFVDGRTLRQLLIQGPLPASVPVVGGQISKALAVAHAAGIVHRDVKPENIMVRKDGYVKVLDFGIARLIRDAEVNSHSPADTNPGRVMGTARYMSPEQTRGDNSAAPSDVFSLGIIFYEMATGTHPFSSDSLPGTLNAINSLTPVAPTILNPKIPGTVAKLILAMLEKDPTSRPTAAEVDAALAGSWPQAESPSHVAVGELTPPSLRRSYNLPIQRTPFIGRRAERAALQPLLLDAGIRLITLTGPGGTGKTRLAVQVAADLAGHFPGGICFANLSPINDPKLVVSAIAQAVGIRELPGRPLIELVKEHINNLGPTLLVLDNFEQVFAAVPVVLEILDACPSVKVLVTSRTVLRVYGEQEFSVLPLPLPESDTVLSPGRLLDFPSIALFVQRATAVKLDFRLTVQNAGEIVEICRRLDGLPLAIELAAARSKILAPDGLLARIASRLELLTGGSRDLPERQRTLRGAIDWSYDLLTPTEQKLFRRLSVFVGGCTLEAAEAVCNTQEDLDDMLDSLSSLVDKSLISQTGSANREPRFTMLETIREYGRERLEQSGELDATCRAHAAYALVLAEERMAEMTQADQDAWLSSCDAEHDNFRAAIDYLVAAGNAEWGLRLGSALLWFWEAREHLTEGRATLAILLEMPGEDAPNPHRAQALLAAGVLADAQFDAASAVRFTNQTLEMRRQLEDKQGIATAINALALQANKRGNYAEARVHIEQALQIWKELGADRVVLGLSNLASIAKNQGDYATAKSNYEAILEAFRHNGDVRGIASALNGLADVAMAQRDYAKALPLYEESLTRFREVEDQWGIGGVLRDLAGVARQTGDYSEAAHLYRESISVFRELGHGRGIARVLEHLACCAGCQSLPERALKLAGAATGMRERLGTPPSATEQEELDQVVKEAREKLTAGEQTKIWTEGVSMSLDQAVDYALAAQPAGLLI